MQNRAIAEEFITFTEFILGLFDGSPHARAKSCYLVDGYDHGNAKIVKAYMVELVELVEMVELGQPKERRQNDFEDF